MTSLDFLSNKDLGCSPAIEHEEHAPQSFFDQYLHDDSLELLLPFSKSDANDGAEAGVVDFSLDFDAETTTSESLSAHSSNALSNLSFDQAQDFSNNQYNHNNISGQAVVVDRTAALRRAKPFARSEKAEPTISADELLNVEGNTTQAVLTHRPSSSALASGSNNRLQRRKSKIRLTSELEKSGITHRINKTRSNDKMQASTTAAVAAFSSYKQQQQQQEQLDVGGSSGAGPPASYHEWTEQFEQLGLQQQQEGGVAGDRSQPQGMASHHQNENRQQRPFHSPIRSPYPSSRSPVRRVPETIDEQAALPGGGLRQRVSMVGQRTAATAVLSDIDDVEGEYQSFPQPSPMMHQQAAHGLPSSSFAQQEDNVGINADNDNNAATRHRLHHPPSWPQAAPYTDLSSPPCHPYSLDLQIQIWDPSTDNESSYFLNNRPSPSTFTSSAGLAINTDYSGGTSFPYHGLPTSNSTSQYQSVCTSPTSPAYISSPLTPVHDQLPPYQCFPAFTNPRETSKPSTPHKLPVASRSISHLRSPTRHSSAGLRSNRSASALKSKSSLSSLGGGTPRHHHGHHPSTGGIVSSTPPRSASTSHRASKSATHPSSTTSTRRQSRTKAPPPPIDTMNLGPASSSRRKITASSSTTARDGDGGSGGFGFVNFTPRDEATILKGVAPSGSSKTKARRELEARERDRKLTSKFRRMVEKVGGDLRELEGLGGEE